MWNGLWWPIFENSFVESLSIVHGKLSLSFATVLDRNWNGMMLLVSSWRVFELNRDMPVLAPLGQPFARDPFTGPHGEACMIILLLPWRDSLDVLRIASVNLIQKQTAADSQALTKIINIHLKFKASNSVDDIFLARNSFVYIAAMFTM